MKAIRIGYYIFSWVPCDQQNRKDKRNASSSTEINCDKKSEQEDTNDSNPPSNEWEPIWPKYPAPDYWLLRATKKASCVVVNFLWEAESEGAARLGAEAGKRSASAVWRAIGTKFVPGLGYISTAYSVYSIVKCF